VPHTLSIRIDPECLTFLDQAQYKKKLSMRQNTFIDSVNDLHATVNQLKKQTDLQFDEKQMKEISRGAFYALTRSLEEKIKLKQSITLPDLQDVFNDEFHIKDPSASNFIIKSLLEPHSLPFALSTLAYSVLTDNSFWSNECTVLNSEFKYTLKAKSDPGKANILFKMRMNLRNAQFPENLSLGILDIQFTIDQQKQIKLLPLDMEFNFVSKKAFKQFKKELCRDFQDWIFLHTSHWSTTDLWVIPILLGCFLGLIAMISLLALSLTPISPLLLPPLGLALGLGLASVMHSYVHMSIKKEQEKFQRPIHIFNRKPLQTTAFFNHPDKITVMANEYHEHGHRHFRIS
jgi:hypothetical protein